MCRTRVPKRRVFPSTREYLKTRQNPSESPKITGNSLIHLVKRQDRAQKSHKGSKLSRMHRAHAAHAQRSNRHENDCKNSRRRHKLKQAETAILTYWRTNMAQRRSSWLGKPCGCIDCMNGHAQKPKKNRLKLQARTSESVNGGQGGKTYLLGAKSRWTSIPNDDRNTSVCGMTCTYRKMRRSKHWSLPRRLCWWLGYQRVAAVCRQ